MEHGRHYSSDYLVLGVIKSYVKAIIDYAPITYTIVCDKGSVL